MSKEPDKEGLQSTDPDEVHLRKQKGFSRRIIQAVGICPVVLILVILLTGTMLIAMGGIKLDFVITGELPIKLVWRTVLAPFLLFLLVGFAFLWLLSIMAWFGAGGVIRVGQTIEKMIRDYDN
jgi:hypothetical protein